MKSISLFLVSAQFVIIYTDKNKGRTKTGASKYRTGSSGCLVLTVPAEIAEGKTLAVQTNVHIRYNTGEPSPSYPKQSIRNCWLQRRPGWQRSDARVTSVRQTFLPISTPKGPQ